MKYKIAIQENDDKVRILVDILGCLYPFSELTGRERDVLALYVKGYLKLKEKGHSKDSIFVILFHYDFTKYISETLSDREGKIISLDLIRNYATKLRQKGLLDKRTIVGPFLYLFENIKDEITFKLVEENEVSKTKD